MRKEDVFDIQSTRIRYYNNVIVTKLQESMHYSMYLYFQKEL